jgi:transcription initiation factor IIE alpha subunit
LVKYEEKFFVINKKHLSKVPRDKMDNFSKALKEIQPYLPPNKYYVCNQDEDYAEDVLKLILFDEMKKQLEKSRI